MVVAKKYVVVIPFAGIPKKTDFKIVEEKLPAPKDGGKYAHCMCSIIKIIPITIEVLYNEPLKHVCKASASYKV